MMNVLGCDLRMKRQTSYPLTLGSIKSRMTKSGCQSRTFSMACSPSTATSISYPSISRRSTNPNRMDSSSSTIRILCMLPLGKSDHHFGSLIELAVYFDLRLVRVQDLLDDGKAQPAAFGLARELVAGAV